MDKESLGKAKELADKIIFLYATQKYTQEAIAKELDISTKFVGVVTREYNYRHRVKKEMDNIKDNEKVKLVIDYKSLAEYL